MRCTLCGQPLYAPLYSHEGRGITSLGQDVSRPTDVYGCTHCGHLQTPPLESLGDYYDTGYGILTNTSDEDQIYRVVNGVPEFRTQHQARVLLARTTLPQGARVLEYGAGKAATLRHVLRERPDLQGHVFDVSRQYETFWAEFLPAARTSSYTLPPEWAGSFDLVCAFFVLEHVVAARDALAQLRGLLKPGGVLHIVVPDVLVNWADFLVAEHVNHFHVDSLRYAISGLPFEQVEIDNTLHDAALVMRAIASDAPPAIRVAPAGLSEKALGLAHYWMEFTERVRAFEAAKGDRAISAIYGAGFYGAHLLSCLRHPERVLCFVDRNPHLQGREWQGRPVVAPAQMPEDVNVVYAGLNPLRAPDIMAGVHEWSQRRHDLYLP